MEPVDKQKIKSGKYAKSNINLVKENTWPHVGILKKYTKRTSFEQLDFESFVAGKTKIILSMADRTLL